MIKIGQHNTLKVIKREEHGFYLQGDDEWDDILLPHKYAPEGLKINDSIKVFIYFDSKDIIIATTQEPLAVVGEFAILKVAAVDEEFGVFLDWGLEKDLLVPFREQLYKMIPGESYVVYVYVDSSERIAASTRVVKHLDKSRALYEEGETVELIPYQATDMGIKAIINRRHDGLIFKDDLIHDVKLGKAVDGFIKKVRDDNKIDLSLRPIVLESRNELVDQIVEKLKKSGGALDVNAKTSADVINSMFKVSRKKFKVALGHLYKKKIISVDETGIKLIK